MLSAFMEAFASLPEPRVHVNKIRHELSDIVAITVCAVICGIDEWDLIEDYAHAKRPWLEQFLKLTNGIPSHDTFSRVFSLIDPDAFGACFVAWVSQIATRVDGRVVPVDGKTLRRSHSNRDGALHMVSAFCTDNSLVLGQVATEEKSNEITAIPRLIDLLDVEGAIITIDAMGAQKAIVDKICDKGADYVIGCKANQLKLHEALVDSFSGVGLDTRATALLDVHITEDKSHGRDRTIGVFRTKDLSAVPMRDDWRGLCSIVMVVTESVNTKGRLTTEKRYYVSSLGTTAADHARVIRSHWEIENRLHWVLDVAFREDDSRIRRNNGAQNLAVIRHAALNLARQDKTTKLGIKNRLKKCNYDNDYLASLLFKR
jgi:predicted transposase YbfD/YdcC